MRHEVPIRDRPPRLWHGYGRAIHGPQWADRDWSLAHSARAPASGISATHRAFILGPRRVQPGVAPE